jgi:hypothetical protein
MPFHNCNSSNEQWFIRFHENNHDQWASNMEGVLFVFCQPFCEGWLLFCIIDCCFFIFQYFLECFFFVEIKGVHSVVEVWWQPLDDVTQGTKVCLAHFPFKILNIGSLYCIRGLNLAIRLKQLNLVQIYMRLFVGILLSYLSFLTNV